MKTRPTSAQKPAADSGLVPGTGGAAIKLRKILVPVDFSEPSLAAMRYTRSLAGEFDAALVLIHVIEPPSFVSGLETVPIAVPDSALVNQLHHKLAMLARRELPATRPATPLVVIGKPFAEIVAAAKQTRADLIVIATHGHTGLKHVLLGSTAERVVRHASCPVLVVRNHERKRD